MSVPCKNIAFLILLLGVTSFADDTAKPISAASPAASSSTSTNSAKPVPVTNSNKPEPRQIAATGGAGAGPGAVGSVGTSGINSVYPYNMYANSIYSGASNFKPQSSSAAGAGGGSGFLSLLRPSGGSTAGSGRRSSLTSRLRNFMSSLFRRGEQPSYLGSASSYNYALRQPPFGFNPGSGGSNAFGSQNAGPNSQAHGLFGSPSNYQPISFPASSSGGVPASSGLWSNYKQWGSPNSASNTNIGQGSHLGAANTANYAWSAPSTGNSQSFGSNAGSGHSSSFQGNSGAQGVPYQAAASNSYPSNYNYNQRSSSSSGNMFKPVNTASGSNSADSSEAFQGIKPNHVV